LYEAFLSLRKDASAGVDHVTYRDYEEQAKQKVQELHERLKNKTYRALPLRRIYIPKEDGKERPISIPALEDKIVQKAAVELLSAIYEQDFPAPTGSVPDAAHKRRWTKSDASYVANQHRSSSSWTSPLTLTPSCENISWR
jgi:hypothetical protein